MFSSSEPLENDDLKDLINALNTSNQENNVPTSEQLYNNLKHILLRIKEVHQWIHKQKN